MRVLVTGHAGYLGGALIPLLLEAGHHVTGYDSMLFEECGLFEASDDRCRVEARRGDIRSMDAAAFDGIDAVVHLAGLCNDPLGFIDPAITFDINHHATAAVASAAKAAGVERFVFLSSCSIYGAHGEDWLTELSEPRPVTPYGESKWRAEQALHGLADASFSPVLLRSATAFGVSPKLRGDLVVNDLVGKAFLTGQVELNSDGSAWRPLVHIADISRAVAAVLTAPRHAVHDRVFNVGTTTENYRIIDVAEIVAELTGARIVVAPDAPVDRRNYRVDCHRIASTVPEFRPVWTLAAGVEELFETYRRVGLTADMLAGAALQRLVHVHDLLSNGRVGPDLRWIDR